MPISDIFQPAIIDAIERLGFPTVLILILIRMIFYTMKRSDHRKIQSDAKYQELVNKFIENIQQITYKHTQSIGKVTTEFCKATDEFKETTSKIYERMNNCMENKEEHTTRIINKINEMDNRIKECNDKHNHNR